MTGAKEYYTIKRLSDYLKIKEATIRKWIREEKLGADRIGSCWRVSSEHLAEFISGGCDEPK